MVAAGACGSASFVVFVFGRGNVLGEEKNLTQLWVCVASPRMCLVIADRGESLSGKAKVRINRGDDPTLGRIFADALIWEEPLDCNGSKNRVCTETKPLEANDHVFNFMPCFEDLKPQARKHYCSSS